MEHLVEHLIKHAMEHVKFDKIFDGVLSSFWALAALTGNEHQARIEALGCHKQFSLELQLITNCAICHIRPDGGPASNVLCAIDDERLKYNNSLVRV